MDKTTSRDCGDFCDQEGSRRLSSSNNRRATQPRDNEGCTGGVYEWGRGDQKWFVMSLMVFFISGLTTRSHSGARRGCEAAAVGGSE